MSLFLLFCVVCRCFGFRLWCDCLVCGFYCVYAWFVGLLWALLCGFFMMFDMWCLLLLICDFGYCCLPF